MINSRRLKASSTLAVLTAFACSPIVATAQTDGQVPDPNAPARETAQDVDSHDRNIAVVVVTAQRRSERMVDVPISVTAVTAEHLTSAGIESTRGLGQVTPGLVMLNAGAQLQPSIRGIQSQGTNAGEESNVALYIDDVYIPSQFAGLFQLKDAERIEVLKGPQGTLFGRNSTGGAIRVTTRSPGPEPVLEFSARHGFELSEQTFSLYGSRSISDSLYFSIAAMHSEDDGFVENINPQNPGKLSKSKLTSARAKLVYAPESGSKYTLSVDTVDSEEEAPNLINIIDNQSSYRSMPGVIIPQKPYQTSYSQNPITVLKGWGASLTGEWSFDKVDIKSISAYRKSDVPRQMNDADRTNLSLASGSSIGFYSKSFSQDINLSSAPSSSPLSWVAGLFYFQSEGGTGIINYSGDVDPSLIISGRAAVVDSRAIAGYGELTYAFTEKFSLTGGVRISDEKKDYAYRDLYLGGQPLRYFTADDSWTNVDYRAVARYKPSDDTTFYLSYGTGFKAGVFNTTIPEANAVEPEEIKAWEIGTKTRLSSSLYLSAAAFSYDYSNIQVASLVVDSQGTRNLLTNAASAEVQGMEASLDASFGDLSLSAGFSWIPESDYVNFRRANVYFDAPNGGNTLVPGTDVSGTRMVRAPELTYHLGGKYERDFSFGRMGFSANYAYNDGFLFAPGEVDPHVRQKSYGLLNASISWTSPNDRFTLRAFGENLLDEVYYLYIIQTANSDAGSYARPREYGLEFDIKF